MPNTRSATRDVTSYGPSMSLSVKPSAFIGRAVEQCGFLRAAIQSSRMMQRTQQYNV